MFQHILVPLDGSPRAEQALPVAARLVAANGGAMVLLRVVKPPEGYKADAEAQTQEVQVAIEVVLAAARSYLDGLTLQYNLHDVQVVRAVVVGMPTASIVAAVETHHADLVIIGSHGYTGYTRDIAGSTAEEVAQSSPVPVLLLREGKPLATMLHPDDASLVRVLVPLDGSSEALTAIEPAAQLAVALSTPARGALHLMRVVILPNNEPSSYADRDDILQEAQRYLSTVVEKVRKQINASRQALRLTGSVTVDDDIASGIARVAESGEDTEGASLLGGCDIIAMATHGYGGVKHGIVGGITERVLQATRLPLLFVQVTDTARRVTRDQDAASTLNG